MTKINVQVLLPRILTFYMLAALLWWSFLLFRKNKEITFSRLELLQLESNVKNNTNSYEIKNLEAYNSILKRHKRQQYMIIGEALVFAITLIIGISLINKTHRKQLENQNRQTNFLLSVTHELRSPLASIILILDTIKKRVLPKDKLDELAGDALNEGERLDKQIHNMLFAAKLDKTYEINKQVFPVKPIIQKIILTYKNLYPDAEINYCNQNEDILVSADKEGLQSIIGNLIENAIKYSPINERKIEVETIQRNKYFTISVKDQGIGIADDQKKMVTNQFYRIGSEDTRNTKGTGLGLYIVDKLVQSHNGELIIRDNIPKGTIFTINLPN